MTKNRWKKLIYQQCVDLRVETEGFEKVIETLAAILEQRDRTWDEWQEAGGRSVIEYTNKGGSTNMTKHPMLVLWDDLNKSALAYWRELGLTPSSYKKMTGDPSTKATITGLEKALKGLELD